MIVQWHATAGLQIAGQADFDWNLPLCEFFDQFGILCCGEAMPNPLSAQIKCPPDRFRPCALTGVGCETQSLCGSVGVLLAK